VSGLFASLPAGGPVRLRNQAILALLWRMGLRAGEVAGLLVEDIDWRNGVILMRGKGNRHEQVPLPADVGASLAAYLKDGCPSGGKHRQVFLTLDAPHGPARRCRRWPRPEQSVRMVKVRQKISGTMRIPQGAQDFVAIRSYLQTAAKQGHNALDVLIALFEGRPWLPSTT